MSEDSVTILKYCLSGAYSFRVMDKFDEPDEVARLDKMIAESKALKKAHGKDYQQVWIKTCPIFDTK